MKHALLDLTSSPPCVVLLTDSDDAAIETAQKYANQTNRMVTIVSGESEEVPPSSLAMVGSPRMLTAADFATAADARRAGFNVPDEPLALVSGTSDDVPKDKEPSGDGSKKTPPKK